MSKGSDFLAAFEREWFAESGIDPTPEDMETLRGSMIHARARLNASVLDLAASLSPWERRFVRVATWITAVSDRLTRRRR